MNDHVRITWNDDADVYYSAFKGTFISSLLFRKRQVPPLSFFNLDFVRLSHFFSAAVLSFFFFFLLPAFFRCSIFFRRSI